MKRSIAVGLISAALCLMIRLIYGMGAWDLAWPLQGAGLLLAGQNPYTMGGYPLDLPLFYPLPTVLFVLPIVWLDPTIASTIFSGVSAAVLAYTIIAYRPQAWPVLTSAPFFVAVIWSQWGPLVMAAASVPHFLPLALLKPNIGLPLFLLRRPSKMSVSIIAAVLTLSLAILPTWPLDWFRNIQTHDSRVPLLSIPGLLLPLALLRWRDPRARLLFGLSCVPIRFYDTLMLWCIPETMRAGLILSILSWLIFGSWFFVSGFTLSHPPFWLVVALLYLPALGMTIHSAAPLSEAN